MLLTQQVWAALKRCRTLALQCCCGSKGVGKSGKGAKHGPAAVKVVGRGKNGEALSAAAVGGEAKLPDLQVVGNVQIAKSKCDAPMHPI